MINLVVGDVDVSKYIITYSCESTPIFSENEIPSYTGEKKRRKQGDTVKINARLEEVPDNIAAAVAAALKGVPDGDDKGKVNVAYTSPLQSNQDFYTTSFKAECEEGDPQNDWIITFTLESSDTAADDGDGL